LLVVFEQDNDQGVNTQDPIVSHAEINQLARTWTVFSKTHSVKIRLLCGYLDWLPEVRPVPSFHMLCFALAIASVHSCIRCV